MTAPAAGATVSGSVTVTASATDAVGVVGVQFKVDGVNVGAEDTTAPYSIAWATTGIANGDHTLTAVARDAAGNSATSAGVTVTVGNDVTAPAVVGHRPGGGRLGVRLRDGDRHGHGRGGRGRRAVQGGRGQRRRRGHDGAVLDRLGHHGDDQRQPRPDRRGARRRRQQRDVRAA